MAKRGLGKGLGAFFGEEIVQEVAKERSEQKAEQAEKENGNVEENNIDKTEERKTRKVGVKMRLKREFEVKDTAHFSPVFLPSVSFLCPTFFCLQAVPEFVS